MLDESIHVSRVFHQPEPLGLQRAGIERFAVMRLIGYLIQPIGDDEYGARRDPVNHLNRAYVREAHSSNLFTPEDYQICQREAGQAGKAAKELDKIALHIGKPALDDQTAQLRLLRHGEGRGNRAE
jgi:hypothetical protein